MEKLDIVNLTSLNGLKNLHDELEKDVLNILNEESNGIVNKYYSSVIEWWSKHIKPKKGGKVKSTALWLAFKKENDELCKELDVAGFKNILSAKGAMLSAKNIFLKKPNAIIVMPNFKF